ncbi:MotA/TolQ/ExbB proton channel [Thermodesulfatator indicus DSM 15286]|uniref:MotA/TolQ/ExbB proton channel n=1 Tax=Thermodesulfatator indicus (strain DSM 15286 / JCM 11887 / CIR29812) TaxID=667014 RepID=F8A926_THEID|nr:MotA/TolQ/ExbB proton channel family protein [Thermodesulfatator indicus]AEH45154.1 MotA/TolQ/ExbB proton channel [Thermodesulfatator indicus DSM 15286]
MNLWYLIFQAGLVAKLTMLVLLFMSIGTWAVIFLKWRQFKQATRGLGELSLIAEKSVSCQELATKLRRYKKSSGWNIARYLLGELVRLRSESALPAKKELFALWLEMFIKRLNRYLNVARERELVTLKEGLSFLAITGNSAPFIGLFGTVWGIMTAFHHIGLKGSASLATVAPGIAEALIATALGLFAAIPASTAYNYFAARLETIDTRLNELGEVIILLIEKEFMHEITDNEEN